jgi:hypothetical protein
MCAVVDPFARRGDPLAGRDRRRRSPIKALISAPLESCDESPLAFPEGGVALVLEGGALSCDEILIAPPLREACTTEAAEAAAAV